jgi:hypothetical protein
VIQPPCTKGTPRPSTYMTSSKLVLPDAFGPLIRVN